MVDQQHRVCRRRRARAAVARAPRSRAVSSPAAGSSRQSRRGRSGERARHADELALTLREIAGHRVGRPSSSSMSSAASSAVGSLGRGVTSSLTSPATRRRGAAHRQVLAHGEVVEQLGALPGARQARGARARAATAPLMSRPSSSTRPLQRHEAGDRVDEASSCRRRSGRSARRARPSPTSSVDVRERVHAAERDGQAARRSSTAVGSDSPATLRFAAAGPRRPRIRRAGRPAPLVHPLVEGARRRPSGLLDQGEDQDHAAEQQEPVAVEPEPLVERVRDERLRSEISPANTAPEMSVMPPA